MAAGEKIFASDIKLAGYLKLIDNPIYLGLSDNAHIVTNLSDNSLNISNLSGNINIDTTNIYLNTNLISSPGLFKYQGIYHSLYDNRTLVDKEYVDNQISLVGVSYWDLNTANELVLNLAVDGPVIPHTNNYIDLGSSSYKWKNIFLQGYINQVNVNNAYTLPTVDGTNGQVLKTNGAGVVTWQSDNNITNLVDLTDVVYPTGKPVEGDILVYNGIEWEPREIPMSFTFTASTLSDKATYVYLNSDGSGTFLSPYILPDNCVLKYLSASCASVTNIWTAEVHVNGVLVPGATLTVSSTSAYIKFTSPITFTAGSTVQLYVNGAAIDRPRINAFFQTMI